MPGLKLKTKTNQIAARVLGLVRPALLERHEVGKFAQRHVSPIVEERDDVDPYAAGSSVKCAGINFDREAQVGLIDAISVHADLFELVRRSPSINTQHHERSDRIRNGYFPTPDAETYAGMIAEFRPTKIVEVGGGFSTLIARAAIDYLGLDTELVVIDPEPRTDVQSAASKLILEPAESVEVDRYELDDSSMLFIDSSHRLRTGGDVAFLYGSVIPSLPAGVRVHIHDIFLPYEYSVFAIGQWWTEQYILQAMLSHNSHYEVEIALRWLTQTEPESMVRAFGESVRESPYGGASLWMRVADGS